MCGNCSILGAEYISRKDAKNAKRVNGENKKTFVWVIDAETQTVSRREVTVGNLTDQGIMIPKGLQPGEWIATAGVHTLKEGQQVKLMQ